MLKSKPQVATIDSLYSIFESKSLVSQKFSEKFLGSDVGIALNQFSSDKDLSVKLIAFYLPQFHAIKENDEWWGEGFTEWSNVKPAKPQFDSHYQPHVPLDLGYYNLLDHKTQKKQIELAKKYGVHGFCFYFYWFSGKTLLESPLENYLQDSDLDLPFCLCWANESWSRRWDGKEHEILIAQDHSESDDIAFIQYISKYLSDKRYIRVNGKPLLIVYRPSLLPNAKLTIQRWREYAAVNGIGELYIAYTLSFPDPYALEYGFDAAIEFPPNNNKVTDASGAMSGVKNEFSGNIYSIDSFLERARNYNLEKFPITTWRGVFPSWDNTPRRKEKSTIFVNASPLHFCEWLALAIKDTFNRHQSPSERVVFVNAWNEWAEGAHLEPDERYGYSWLEACRSALNIVSADMKISRKLIVLCHDFHPHGAQYLALSLCQTLIRLGFDLQILSQGAGLLQDEFSSLAPTHIISAENPTECNAILESLQKNGYNYVLANTVVSGRLVKQLALRGLRVLTLIHELPEVISSFNLYNEASAVVKYSERVVFPSSYVRNQFPGVNDIDDSRILIRHQGLIRSNPFKGKPDKARQLIVERHNIPCNSIVITSVGFLERRKGPDLLVQSIAELRRSSINVHCFWIGHYDSDVLKEVNALIDRYHLQDCFHLLGFIKDPLEYYAAADVYALPSREDPFPNVVLESLNVNVPVVAFRGSTGCEELIIQHGGVLVEPFDIVEFAKCMLSLTNKTSLTKSSENIASFSMQRYALDLCHKLIGTPRVSVIVPNYNYAHVIIDRLESIRSQTFSPYEIIILDDASRDDSVSIISEWCRKCGSDTKLIVNSSNSGSPFKQWIRGVDQARGELVWIAEADDLSRPEFLYELVEAFADPAVVMAYSDSLQINDHGNKIADNYSQWTSDIGAYWDNDYSINGLEEIARSLAVKNVIPNVSAVLFNREVLMSALHRCRNQLSTLKVAGDWRLYLEILTNGKISFVSQSLNLHRRHDASVTVETDSNLHFSEVKEMQSFALEILASHGFSKSELNNIQKRSLDYLDDLGKYFSF